MSFSWGSFGTNEDLGNATGEQKVIDNTPLIFTSTQIMSF